MPRNWGFEDVKEGAEKKADSLLGAAIDSPETGPKADKILTDVKNSSNTAVIVAGTAIGVILAGVLTAYYMFK